MLGAVRGVNVCCVLCDLWCVACDVLFSGCGAVCGTRSGVSGSPTRYTLPKSLHIIQTPQTAHHAYISHHQTHNAHIARHTAQDAHHNTRTTPGTQHTNCIPQHHTKDTTIHVVLIAHLKPIPKHTYTMHHAPNIPHSTHATRHTEHTTHCSCGVWRAG